MGSDLNTAAAEEACKPFDFNSTLKQSVLDKCKNRIVVLSGCGGGCDVYGCTYLFRQISAVAKKVVLANLSFTSSFNLHQNGKCVDANTEIDQSSMQLGYCYKILPNTVDMSSTDAINKNEKLSTDYFPEASLANALQHPVYAFRGGTMHINEIADAHKAILIEEGLFSKSNKSDESEKKNEVDDSNDTTSEQQQQKDDTADDDDETAILFLVDGGCDVLLTGTETGLATPVEDMMHLKAVLSLMKKVNNDKNNNSPVFYDGDNSFICAIGANVDGAHGVVESELVTRLANLKRSGAMICSKNLTTEDEEAKFFCEIVKKCNPVDTIVQSLAVSAIEGHRDNYTPDWLKPRIGRNKIKLSELTSTFFFFDLKKVALEVRYLPMVDESDNSNGFCATLGTFRRSIGKN